MWSSDLSLTLTSDSRDEDEYAFVGKRKKTPLTIIPLGRYKPPRPTRPNGGRRKGDEALRYAQQDVSAFDFRGFREISSSSFAVDDGGGQLPQSNPPSSPNHQTSPEPIDINAGGLSLKKVTQLGPPTAGPPTAGPPRADPPRADPPRAGPPRAELLSRCILPSLPPSANPSLRTCAYAVGTSHARAALCIQKLRNSVEGELKPEKLQADLEPLRVFAAEHALQLELWTHALTKWCSFLRSLFPTDLAKDPRVSLSVNDGEALLAVLPSSTTLAFCETNLKGAHEDLNLTAPVQKLLSIPGIAEMAVSLAICLKVLEAARCAQRYYAIVSNLLQEFTDVPAYKRLIQLARNLLILRGEEAENGADTISVWSLSTLIADQGACRRLVASLTQEDLFNPIRTIQLDEVMDLIEQVDLEIVFEQIRLYILNCLASLGQSLALLRSVNCQVRTYCTSSDRMAKNENMPRQSCSTGGPTEMSGSDTTAHTDSTHTGSDQQILFNEKNVNHRIRKLFRQIEALRANLRSQLARTLADHLGLREAYQTAAPMPIGALLKTLVIVIESMRNCSRVHRSLANLAS